MYSAYSGSTENFAFRSSHGPHSNVAVYYHPVPSLPIFFCFFVKTGREKPREIAFALLMFHWEFSSWRAEQGGFFFLRAATLTKEYQMKVGWKTATKSPTGTGTSLCNINSHFLPTSQFKASFVAIACITQLYHTFIISHIKVKKTKGGVKYSGLIIQKTHCIVKRNNKRNEGLSFLCKNGKNTIIRFLRLCTRIECTM